MLKRPRRDNLGDREYVVWCGRVGWNKILLYTNSGVGVVLWNTVEAMRHA